MQMYPYDTIPQPDRYVMREAYAQGNRLDGLNVEDVIHKIAWRIYTEFCLNNQNLNDRAHYDGQTYRKWVDDEVHYAFERRGKNGSCPQEYNERDYECMRNSVLRAIVARATELLRDWNGGTTPLDLKDPRNLRANLEEYMRGNRMEKAA